MSGRPVGKSQEETDPGLGNAITGTAVESDIMTPTDTTTLTGIATKTGNGTTEAVVTNPSF